MRTAPRPVSPRVRPHVLHRAPAPPRPRPPVPAGAAEARPPVDARSGVPVVRGLDAAATIGTPALWAAAVAQAPAGSARGVVLALGWVGLASLFGRGRRGDR